jgi:hypothetical protein
MVAVPDTSQFTRFGEAHTRWVAFELPLKLNWKFPLLLQPDLAGLNCGAGGSITFTGEHAALEIHVAPGEAGSFGEPHPGVGEEFHQISAVPRAAVHPADGFDEQTELRTGGNGELGLGMLAAFDAGSGIVERKAVAPGVIENQVQGFAFDVAGAGGEFSAALGKPGVAVAGGDVADGGVFEVRLDGFQPAAGEFVEGQCAGVFGLAEARDLRAELGETARGGFTLKSFERAAKLLAVTFDEGIVNAG